MSRSQPFVIVLLATLSAGAGGATSAEQTATFQLAGTVADCERYATDAVLAYDYNIKHVCGFGGPSWSNDWNGHKFWCIGAPDDQINSENNIRGRLIWACQNLEHDCVAYGESAVAQQWANVNAFNYRPACEGPAWSYNRADHESWCLHATPEQRRHESNYRAAHMSKC